MKSKNSLGKNVINFRFMAAVVLVYLGLCGALIALISLIHPLRLIGIHDRLAATLILAGAVIMLFVGAILPAHETRVSPPRTELDLIMPAYQFSEFHSIRVAAPREAVYEALQDVTPDEIFLFRTLVWLRRFGQPGPPSILNPPPGRPLLEVAKTTSFLPLREAANEEVVFGTLVAAPRGWRPRAKPSVEGYEALLAGQQPGFAFAVMNFRLEGCVGIPQQPCTNLTTETRVYIPDASTRRRFACYWRVIYPGSSFIRRMWLRAVARKAISRADRRSASGSST